MTQEEFSLLFHRAKVNYVAFRQLYEPVAFEAMHRMVEMAIAEEREACAKIVETYRIPVGNSPAGEMACKWTHDALKEIRDAIRARGNK